MSNIQKTLFFSLVSILLTSLIINTSKNIIHLRNIKQDLGKKEQELNKLIDQNKELRDKLIALDDNTIEALVRDKLSMAKEGETMIILPEDIKKLSDQSLYNSSQSQKSEYQNWQKWLKLFGVKT